MSSSRVRQKKNHTGESFYLNSCMNKSKMLLHFTKSSGVQIILKSFNE